MHWKLLPRPPPRAPFCHKWHPERKGGGPRAGIRVSGLDPAWPCPRGLHPPCPRPAGSGTGAHARSAAQPRACSSVARQLELLARLTAAVPGRNVPSLARPGEALAVTVRVRGATARRVGCYGSKRGRAFGEHPRFVRQRSASRSSTATGAGGRSRVCDGRLVGSRRFDANLIRGYDWVRAPSSAARRGLSGGWTWAAGSRHRPGLAVALVPSVLPLQARRCRAMPLPRARSGEAVMDAGRYRGWGRGRRCPFRKAAAAAAAAAAACRDGAPPGSGA